MQAKIGQLILENDFLENERIKATPDAVYFENAGAEKHDA